MSVGSRSVSSALVPGTEWNLTIPTKGPTTRRLAVRPSSDLRPSVPAGSEDAPGTPLSSGSPLLRRVGEPSRRGLEPRSGVLAEASCEGREVVELRALLLPLLPLPVTLSCRQTLSPLAVHLTTARGVWMALRRCNRVVYGVEEWKALVSAFGEERASPVSFAGWCELKARTPTWKLSPREAMGLELAGRGGETAATVGEVLKAWGLGLTAVSYGAEVPA